MTIKGFRQKLPGYIAVGLLIALTSFWTYWGVGEAFHEGWWGAWYNPLPYLVPAEILLALTLAGIKWPWQGGWAVIITGAAIFVGWLVMSEFSPINLFLAFLLGGLAALVGVLFLFKARRRKRWHSENSIASKKWFQRNLSYLAAIGLPLLDIIAFSAYWLPIVTSREDDGDGGARLIEGNGVTLLWAPAGPGWNEQYYFVGEP